MKDYYTPKYIDVEASYPHLANTYYRVMFDEEKWNGKHVQVIKVQMVYNGKIAAEKRPSESEINLIINNVV